MKYIRKETWAIFGVILALVVLGQLLPTNSKVLDSQATSIVASETSSNLKEVTLIPVSAFDSLIGSFSVIGEVRTENQSDLRAETTGLITNVNYRVGSKVSRGAIIAEVENSRERAAVVQAQGVLDAAKANLDNVTGGARSESLAVAESKLAKEQLSMEEAQRAARIAFQSAYVSTDDSIRARIDTLFNNPRTEYPTFILVTTDTSTEYQLEWDRVFIERGLEQWQEDIENLTSTTNIRSLLEEKDLLLDDLTVFLDEVSLLVNKQRPTATVPASTIESWKTTVTAARNSLVAAQTTISSARERLAGQELLVSVAENELSIARTGGDSEEVRASEAAVKQAEGALAIANATLEKSLIRAPFSGTVVELPIRTGDFVNMFEIVGRVSGGEIDEVVVLLGENDLEGLKIGDTVRVDDNYLGFISSIAPSLSTQTSRAEVIVTLADGVFLSGQKVLVEFARGATTSEKKSDYSIPITALKITAGKNFVYTVDDNDEIVANEVTIGSPLGDKILILDGLRPSMSIIEDVRGLKIGQKVNTI